MKKYAFVSTPIYYVNGNPHVGHAHTSIMGDILKREFQLQGYDVFLTTGVDEHGQKNQTMIEKSGLSAKEYLDQQSAIYQRTFDLLNIKYDKYVRTTEESHIKAVKNVLQLVYDKGLIVKKEYEGLYCVGCEMFKTNADLDENGLCIDHQTKPIKMKEINYFFTLSKYQDWLKQYIYDHPDWIQPAHFKADVLHMLEEPLPDLCISRPKSRCKLGIELPFDSDYVTYVWFDALINYISSLGYPNNMDNVNNYWANSIHLMGKDIIKTHCIYWPIMLKAIGIEPQTHNQIHGYWTGEGGIKMSKTIGNVVEPSKVVEQFGVEPFRYFLARTMGDNKAPISYDLIKSCYNTEIVNSMSNAFYRTMKLAGKLYNGSYPQDVSYNEEHNQFIAEVAQKARLILNETPTLAGIADRCSAVYDIAKMINGFFDKCAPWALAKQESLNDFNSCILTCVETLRIMAEVAYPIIPETAETIIRLLGFSENWKNSYVVQERILNAGMKFEKPIIIFARKD